MNLLKIENDNGFYLSEDGSYKSLEQISKEDLLFLVNKVLNEEACCIDSIEEKSLKNQAHNIIYKNISLKLTTLSSRRREFHDEIIQVYKDEYEKYKK